ncbi:hypothetical protein NQ317_018736 [Molorchus minor]|uniref:Uncharacterized protein n=1 Tax=Molorchus minor TaxID=1323400 RepID=A0ABQ9IQA6_9CUCU|nr:hypothetical protein NQ317_018736 [Molorchus minor]
MDSLTVLPSHCNAPMWFEGTSISRDNGHTEKVGPQMQEALRKTMFHVAWSPDTLPTKPGVGPLFEYLHTHLQALNVALLRRIFQKVLSEF